MSDISEVTVKVVVKLSLWSAFKLRLAGVNNYVDVYLEKLTHVEEPTKG